MIPLLNMYVGIAFMIMILAISIAKMMGKTMNKPDIEAWANVEFSSLLITALIYGLIIAFYTVLETVAMEWTGSSLHLAKFSVKILSGLLEKTAEVWLHVVSIEHQLKIFEGATQSFGPGLLNWQWKLFPGMTLYIRAMEAVMVVLLSAFVSLKAQIIGLDLITVLSYNIFLPLGLIFRVFPPLRNAGNELIAISISFGILIPFFYVVTFKAMADIEEQFGVNGLVSSVVNRAGSLSVVEGETADISQKIVKFYNSGLMFFVQSLAPGIANFFSYMHPMLMVGLTPLLLRVFSHMGVVIAAGVVIPSFSLALSLAFVRATVDVLDFKPTSVGVLI